METQKLTRKEKIAQGLEKQPRRKRAIAEARREERKTVVDAHLFRDGYSPRKMRLLADAVRGKKVSFALAFLKLSTKGGADPLRKLILSAVANYTQKFEGQRVDEEQLYIKSITVDGGMFLKRFRPAPQGRAYRVRKRTNHVHILIDTLENKV